MSMKVLASGKSLLKLFSPKSSQTSNSCSCNSAHPLIVSLWWWLWVSIIVWRIFQDKYVSVSHCRVYSSKVKNGAFLTCMLSPPSPSIWQLSVGLSLMVKATAIIFRRACVFLGLQHLILKTTEGLDYDLEKAKQPQISITWTWSSSSATTNLLCDFEQVMSWFGSSCPELQKEVTGLAQHTQKHVPGDTCPTGDSLHQEGFHNQMNWGNNK